MRPTNDAWPDSPKEIYRCEIESCHQSFVRQDLWLRHQKKHADENVALSAPDRVSSARHGRPLSEDAPESISTPPRKTFDFSQTSYLRTGSEQVPSNVRVLHWQPSDGVLPVPSDSKVVPAAFDMPHGLTLPTPESSNAPSLPTAPYSISSWRTQQDTTIPSLVAPTQANDNFADWLFDSPDSQSQLQGFDLSGLPQFDFGMEFLTDDFWNFDDGMNQFGSDPNARSSLPEGLTLDLGAIDQRTGVSEERRAQIVGIVASYWHRKRPPSVAEITGTASLLYYTEDGQWPNISAAVLTRCLSAFWSTVAKQLPIIHQPTFACNECKAMLLLSMIALGAGQLVKESPYGTLCDYRAFADLIVLNLRWDIFPDDDAQPPVQLWVAQALLCVEHYEKLYASRRLHERAHIHHASTITLLRRGSPMVGDDSPDSGMRTRVGSPSGEEVGRPGPQDSAIRRWWRQWVASESMRRVVFTAFIQDVLSEALFGHESVLAPFEIRLALPCDDALWQAKSPEEVRQLERTFAMHNIKPVNFLEGLKGILHRHQVPTHYDARLILVVGLLSVSCHINRREKHMIIGTAPSAREQERWHVLLLQAYGHWRRSLETALEGSNGTSDGSDGSSKGFAEPSMLYHLAHIVTQMDIIDAQVFAGAKQDRGRKVSEKEGSAVIHRMQAWSQSPTAKVAVSHAFRLLDETLSPKRQSVRAYGTSAYTCRSDPLIYRPWTLYISGLAIWSYQYASDLRTLATGFPEPPKRDATVALQYLRNCASLENADRLPLLLSTEGCAAVLSVLADDLATAESEILQEASRRLRGCAKMLYDPRTHMLQFPTMLG